MQGVDELPDEEDGHDADEDADGRRAFQEAVEAIEQQGYQHDVDDVNDSDLYEKVYHGGFLLSFGKNKGFFQFHRIFHMVHPQNVGSVCQSNGVEDGGAVLRVGLRSQ